MAKPQVPKPWDGWLACNLGNQPLYGLSPRPAATTSRAVFTVTGEQVITWAICRRPAPSSAILRRCSICSCVNAGGRPTCFPPARARSKPYLIRSLAESTWEVPWASIDRLKNFAAALPSLVSIFSRTAVMPMPRPVNSA